MSSQARLVILRHGQTEWNAIGRFQGTTDVPLDEVGHAQARSVAKELARLEPTAIIVSDLQRAQQTAAPLAEICQLTPRVDSELREIHVGKWEGLTRNEVASQFPDEFERWVAGEDVRRGGGETLGECGRRGANALTKILSAYSAETTVIAVSHGIVMQRAIMELSARGNTQFADTGLRNKVPHLGNAEWLRLT